MALQMKKTVEVFGKEVVFNTAYLSIKQLHGGKDKQTVLLVSYDSAAKEHVIDEATYVFTPSMNGENFFKQAYQHLKTLSEFSTAEDV